MGRPECIKGKRMKNIKIAMLVLVVCLSSVGFAFAQVENDTKEKVVKTPPPPPKEDCPSEEACEFWGVFKKKYGKPSIVEWNGRTGALRHIWGLNYDTSEGEVKSAEKAERIAEKFIEDNKALWKVNMTDLKVLRVEYNNMTDPALNITGGEWVVDYQQHYQDIPVENSFVGVTITDKGKIYSAGSGFHPNISISTTPTISKSKAMEIAKRAVNVSIITNLDNVSLTVLPQKSDSGFEYFLVWIAPIQGYSVSGVWNSYKVFVDAQSGEVVKKYSNLMSVADGSTTGDIIRYNLGFLLPLVVFILIFLFIVVYWWRRGT